MLASSLLDSHGLKQKEAEREQEGEANEVSLGVSFFMSHIAVFFVKGKCTD